MQLNHPTVTTGTAFYEAVALDIGFGRDFGHGFDPGFGLGFSRGFGSHIKAY
ncbi:hypothetical protein GQ43DRAFT_440470 [Delitschia confertaspora ATCC 74209]|uniref:Uncharacterized protein n=1 Tax=Delitschia confertaspora ATCC 74209 TaxID=1513339 RepID=A0A9P4JNP5_9PLEO|nr:hypothetical protein GQ43DRAFT_440470 [Delitschia confertaspora ATCC 74209]